MLKTFHFVTVPIRHRQHCRSILSRTKNHTIDHTTGPPSTGPPTVDLTPIRLIHRSLDSFTAFGTKRQSTWHDLFSLSADSLRTVPANALQCLGTDAYFSLNGMYRAGHGLSRTVPGLPRAFRQTNGLRYLNVVYTDLDAHKAGPDAPLIVENTLAEVATMTKAGMLPAASIIVRSGRGAWLLWLLSDARSRLPPRSTAENKRLYRETQSAIQRRLTHLGADPLAVDAVRMARVPGSIHSGTERPVRWEIQPGADGMPPLYTLADLAEAFGVPRQAPLRTPSAIDCRSTPKLAYAGSGEKSSGWANVNRSRLRQLEQLQLIRNGFSEGCRNFAALLLATTLHRLGVGVAETSESVADLAAKCHPPLPESECKSTIKSGTSGRYNFTNHTISTGLCISAEEAEQLETWGPAGVSHSLAVNGKAKANRSKEKASRHKAILSIVEQGGGVLPSIRGMMVLLKQQGHEVTKSQVQRDYKALGLSGDGQSSSPTLVPLEAPVAAA